MKPWTKGKKLPVNLKFHLKGFENLINKDRLEAK